MHKVKFHGTDGILPEFYATFWSLPGPVLVAFFSFSREVKTTLFLAQQLQVFLTKLVHSDQNGFIKSRFAPDSVRMLLHVIDDKYLNS